MKKIAAIHDLSGLGRCSLTVAIPIISSLKLQCCPLPTAILSNQTEYPEYTFLDFTNHMNDYKNTWSKLNLKLNSIYTGFLGSKEQVNIVCELINDNPDALIIVDPVLGDNGSIYPTFDNNMCLKVKDLVKLSHLTTPNLTEACILTDRNYSNINLDEAELLNMAKDISKLGPSKVIITGIIKDDNIINFGYDKDLNTHFFVSVKYNGKSYSGTGDIFTSIICGLLNREYDLKFAVKTATDYIFKCIEYTKTFNTNRNDGVLFEQFLGDLTNI